MKKTKIAKYAKIITVEMFHVFQLVVATMVIEFVGSMFGPVAAVITVSSMVIMFTLYYRFKFVRTYYIWNDNNIIKGRLN